MSSGSHCINIVDVSMFVTLLDVFICDFGPNRSDPPKKLAPPLETAHKFFSETLHEVRGK